VEWGGSLAHSGNVPPAMASKSVTVKAVKGWPWADSLFKEIVFI